MSFPISLRVFLLKEVKKFVASASKVSGVLRIAMIGSLVTAKENPKDADVLVTVDNEFDIDELAKIGRRLKGSGQTRNSGADIFLCNKEGEYLGRTCSFKECHPRARCLGRQCIFSTRICDDFNEVQLEYDQINNPPLTLWPEIIRKGPLPADVEEILIGEGNPT